MKTPRSRQAQLPIYQAEQKAATVEEGLKSMGRLKEGESYFTKVRLHRSLSLSGDKNTVLLLIQEGQLSRERFISCLKEDKGEVTVPFLHLLSFKCFQLKIIFMPKWPISGWLILLPFSTIYLFIFIIFKNIYLVVLALSCSVRDLVP